MLETMLRKGASELIVAEPGYRPNDGGFDLVVEIHEARRDVVLACIYGSKFEAVLDLNVTYTELSFLLGFIVGSPEVKSSAILYPDAGFLGVPPNELPQRVLDMGRP